MMVMWVIDLYSSHGPARLTHPVDVSHGLRVPDTSSQLWTRSGSSDGPRILK